MSEVPLYGNTLEPRVVLGKGKVLECEVLLYRSTSSTRKRTLRKRTEFDPCIFLIYENRTDQILPPFS